jgi:hypothetical protein
MAGGAEPDGGEVTAGQETPRSANETLQTHRWGEDLRASPFVHGFVFKDFFSGRARRSRPHRKATAASSKPEQDVLPGGRWLPDAGDRVPPSYSTSTYKGRRPRRPYPRAPPHRLSPLREDSCSFVVCGASRLYIPLSKFFGSTFRSEWRCNRK